MTPSLAILDAWPLALIALAILAVLMAAVMRLQARHRARVGAPVPGPVEVPPEEAELEEGPVMACMRCGSIQLRQPRLSEGLIPGAGESLAWMCARCKWRGQPLLFDDVTAFRQFVKGLHADRDAAEGKPDEGAENDR